MEILLVSDQHYFFLVFLLRLFVRIVVVMKLMMKTNRLAFFSLNIRVTVTNIKIHPLISSWIQIVPFISHIESLCFIFLNSLALSRRNMIPCFWSLLGRESHWWPLLCLQTNLPLSSTTCCLSSWPKLWVSSLIEVSLSKHIFSALSCGGLWNCSIRETKCWHKDGLIGWICLI